MKRTILIWAGLVLLLGQPAQAHADLITGLYNTGVDSTSTPLSDGTVGDPHYSLVSVPTGSTTDILVRTSSGGYPIPPYIGDDSKSNWIGPNNDHYLDGPIGNYDYQTTFTLVGNPATASITGGWSTDNSGVEILLNGVNTGIPGTDFTQFEESFAPFTISSGFQSGVNTLDFIVNNGGGPTALRVEMDGSVSAVPEPSGIALLGLSIVCLAVGYAARKRKLALAA
jgi:hypothetical protein